MAPIFSEHIFCSVCRDLYNSALVKFPGGASIRTCAVRHTDDLAASAKLKKGTEGQRGHQLETLWQDLHKRPSGKAGKILTRKEGATEMSNVSASTSPAKAPPTPPLSPPSRYDRSITEGPLR